LKSVKSPVLLMTKGAFAARRGVGASAVSNWAKADLLVMAEDPGNPAKMLVDVARTEARLNAKLDPARGRPRTADAAAQGDLPLAPTASAAPAGGSLADVRTDLIRQQTEKLQLENARRAGDLVPLEEFARRAAEYGRVARERMLSIVRSQAEWLAAARDPRAVVAQLEDEIERAFADLAAQIASGAVADAGEVEDEDDAAVQAEVAQALAEQEADEREAG
jgi:hypothetical protein